MAPARSASSYGTASESAVAADARRPRTHLLLRVGALFGVMLSLQLSTRSTTTAAPAALDGATVEMAAGATVETAAGAARGEAASGASGAARNSVITLAELVERPEVRAYLGRHNLSRASPAALMDTCRAARVPDVAERVTGAVGSSAADGVVAATVTRADWERGAWTASWLVVATYAGELLHFSPTFTAGGATVFDQQLNSCALKPWRGGARLLLALNNGTIEEGPLAVFDLDGGGYTELMADSSATPGLARKVDCHDAQYEAATASAWVLQSAWPRCSSATSRPATRRAPSTRRRARAADEKLRPSLSLSLSLKVRRQHADDDEHQGDQPLPIARRRRDGVRLVAPHQRGAQARRRPARATRTRAEPRARRARAGRARARTPAPAPPAPPAPEAPTAAPAP